MKLCLSFYLLLRQSILVQYALDSDLLSPTKFVKFLINCSDFVAMTYFIAKTCYLSDQSTFFIPDGIICITLRLHQID